ncbi:MAG: MATE family efflux transporter, partial [Clostridia bacterium]|nr:MATE family efflux transporter [Clostridia bacterium]
SLPSAYMQSMSAFVSQNIGAHEFSRARKALLCGILTSLSVGVLMFFFTFFHGDLLAGIFAKDKPDAIFYAAEYLKAYGIDCIFVSFLFCFIGYFNGYGKTRFVMCQGLMGAFCVRIPVSFIMSTLEPVSVFNIGLATPCSTVVQITMCFIYFAVITRREKRLLAPKETRSAVK